MPKKTGPMVSSVPLTGTAAEILALKARVSLLEAQVTHLHSEDFVLLEARTQDLNARLKHFEEMEMNGGPLKAYNRTLAEINDLEVRVTIIERPEVEDEAK